jgi:hypothetical protein
MILVGITGTIDSGKTTLADYLSQCVDKSAHYESWELIAEVATVLRLASAKHPAPSNRDAINEWLQPLPALIENITHKHTTFADIELTKERVLEHPENYNKLFEYLELMNAQPELQQSVIDEASKETFRSLLQWLGGYLARVVGGDIWYAELIRRIKQRGDLDLVTIGGVRFPADANCIRDQGGAIISIQRPDLARRDQFDLTEREQSLITPDCGIINNGSLEQLQVCAAKVITDMQAGSLELTYAAASFTA